MPIPTIDKDLAVAAIDSSLHKRRSKNKDGQSGVHNYQCHKMIEMRIAARNHEILYGINPLFDEIRRNSPVRRSE